MHRIVVLFFFATLIGCQATAVKKATTIETQKQLATGVSTPVQVPIAYYVSQYKPKKGLNFYGKLEEAADLVASDMFVSADKLSAKSDFQFLLKLKAHSEWDRLWGGWGSNVTLEVLNRAGKTIYTSSFSSTSSGAGLYDFNAVYNSLAAAVKELVVDFLNTQGEAGLSRAVSAYQAKQVPMVSFKKLFKNSKPTSTGTGFFINSDGHVMTAAHVVDECVYVEVAHKGKNLKSDVVHESDLLDLAVIKTASANTQHVMIGAKTVPVLGKQVFVAGFPLSGLLSDYPSLTVGNVSSRGGLKGSNGSFQFSAPIQPGNSGGAIVDYRGNLIGLVSSTLNQGMMLKKTGLTSQNLNFGIELSLLKKFMDKHQVRYALSEGNSNFEKASADAVEYTNQVLCYK